MNRVTLTITGETVEVIDQDLVDLTANGMVAPGPRVLDQTSRELPVDRKGQDEAIDKEGSGG